MKFDDLLPELDGRPELRVWTTQSGKHVVLRVEYFAGQVSSVQPFWKFLLDDWSTDFMVQYRTLDSKPLLLVGSNRFVSDTQTDLQMLECYMAGLEAAKEVLECWIQDDAECDRFLSGLKGVLK